MQIPGLVVMRKKTLAAVCSILAFAILLTLRLAGVSVPLGLLPFLVFLVLVPLLMIPMTLLNQRLLTWRKARGRDIEEEEKFENEDAGIISLRPKSESAMKDDERRHIHPIFR